MSGAFEWSPLDAENHWSYSTTEGVREALEGQQKAFVTQADVLLTSHRHKLYYVWTTTSIQKGYTFCHCAVICAGIYIYI